MALHPFEVALIPYIQQFVERQKIVEQAMSELRPDYRLRSENYFAWITNYINNPNKIPQMGYWGENQEWRYFFHGNGCNLTHVHTREDLDWDISDVDVFDFWFFKHWLEWALTQEDGLTDLRQWTDLLDDDLGEQLKIVIQHLVDHGILKAVYDGYRYAFVKETQE